jgi:protein-S-isoprenylcysteine O-methyltransferase Ste14
MPERGFRARHGIVRDAIREDLLQFALPAIVVFTAGLVLSGTTGWLGLAATTWELMRYHETAVGPSGWEVAGLLMILLGFAIAFVAVGTLRLFYASTLVIKKDHRLVTHGIYRVVRHPAYLGVLMVSLGIPLHASSPIGLVTMAVLVPVFLNRIRIEEKLLTEEFGERYEAYRLATSKLVPFLL